MATKKIENRRNGANLDRCTTMQRIFVLEMMAMENSNPTEAARRAKLKHPAQAAARLLKLPHIKALLGKFQREREERTQITSDYVWEYMKRVLTFDPDEVYESAGDGWWYIEKLRDIPKKIRQMIEASEPAVMKTGEDDEGKAVYEKCMKVKFVSKENVFGHAVKHALPPVTQQHDVKVSLDLDSLVMDQKHAPCIVEERLLTIGVDKEE